MAECSCEKCVKACKRYPGWFSVEEASRAIDGGHAKRLMLDWYAADPDIYVLAPAGQGYEGKSAPFWPDEYMQCTFLINDRCTIHDSGFKPRMCCESMICQQTGPSKKDFTEDWDTDEGRDLINRWWEMV